MACHWRIRHKLMLGLGLVVVIVGVVLAGTIKGLLSYRATMRCIDSKLVELYEAQRLKADITNLGSGPTDANAGLAEEWTQLRARLVQARDTLAAYQGKLQETLQRQRDPDQGEHEKGLIADISGQFAALEQAMTAFSRSEVAPLQSTAALRHDPAVQASIAKLMRAADELHEAIYADVYRRLTLARRDYEWSLAMVLTSAIGGVLLLAGSLRFFYLWTFAPIEALQQGVQRVSAGDFDHPIVVQSKDELEELAAAFNAMTARLQEMYRDLARQVNERSRQLVRSERLASVGFLAAGVAHEINNPLASIAFCSEALESRLTGLLAREPESGEVITKYLRMIQEAAFRCKKITERLLEFSRSSESRREPTDLAELIQAVLDVAEHLPNSKGKHIVFAPTVRPVAWVNSQEINQVVLNLVVNALDSLDEGGTLTIELRQRDGMAEMIFRDNGCGMTPDVLENIFEPFFTRSRSGKGTGLGLTISHLIISQHRGEIEAASPGPNQGSTFTVRLPLKPADDAVSAGRSSGVYGNLARLVRGRTASDAGGDPERDERATHGGRSTEAPGPADGRATRHAA
ncbi:MAG: ATP-binding protein [Gemmataceae bacterium]|nr:ATP-binding protein [Gemmataceae bacterium]MDW8265230.1 ATP-binding protein [Gemmataceae bacterium]